MALMSPSVGPPVESAQKRFYSHAWALVRKGIFCTVGVSQRVGMADVLQGTPLDEDLLFVKFEGQQMHIQQMWNMLVNGHNNDMKVAVARFYQCTSSLLGAGW